jgi:hypothetical protein
MNVHDGVYSGDQTRHCRLANSGMAYRGHAPLRVFSGLNSV